MQGYQARPRDFEEEASEAVVSIGLAVIQGHMGSVRVIYGQ